ncbi:MAG: hypothetical protein IJW45_04625 [Oscillospiraceae bacterium]|nr:hypothetical protein [Oscillospiraceae bacterium]
MTGKYDDIIHLPHHTSPSRKGMSMIDRAAQFSPFAALVGYDDAIEETARLTGQQIELDENEKYILDLKQQHLLTMLPQMPQITVTYFSPDDRKDGGEYVTLTGRLKSILPHADTMILSDGTSICLKDVIRLDSPVFQNEI